MAITREFILSFINIFYFYLSIVFKKWMLYNYIYKVNKNFQSINSGW